MLLRTATIALCAAALASTGALAATGHGAAAATARTPSAAHSTTTTTRSPAHTTGQPSRSCEDTPNQPGHSISAPGSAFNPSGTAGTHYAGEQPQNSRNTASVSQYDVACTRPTH